MSARASIASQLAGVAIGSGAIATAGDAPIGVAFAVFITYALGATLTAITLRA